MRSRTATGLAGPRVVQITAATMGTGDDELGALLMRSFLKTQAQLDRRPDAVLFYNDGVKLCCEGSVLLDDLEALEAAGVEIIACGTCLNFFDLADRLRVGRVTDMLEIASRLADAGSDCPPVSWVRPIYLDHGATAFPKAPGVTDAMVRFLAEASGNPGRGGHRLTVAASRAIEGAREEVAALLGGDPERTLFGPGATFWLNTILNSRLERGTRVVVSALEHNAVMRPLRWLEEPSRRRDRGGHRIRVSRCADDLRGRGRGGREENGPGGADPRLQSSPAPCCRWPRWRRRWRRSRWWWTRRRPRAACGSILPPSARPLSCARGTRGCWGRPVSV